MFVKIQDFLTYPEYCPAFCQNLITSLCCEFLLVQKFQKDLSITFGVMTRVVLG